MLQSLPGGGFAKPFVTRYNAMHADFYLRIATELYLKRCVVGGFERVFEVGRIFRNEGTGPKYNPEFTMLEAYQAYGDYLDMAELVEYLVAGAANAATGGTKITYQGRELDLTPPWRKATMTEVVKETTGVEVTLEMGLEQLRRAAGGLGVELEARFDAGEVMTAIYEKTTEPELWGPVHVMTTRSPSHRSPKAPVEAGLCGAAHADRRRPRDRRVLQRARRS